MFQPLRRQEGLPLTPFLERNIRLEDFLRLLAEAGEIRQIPPFGQRFIQLARTAQIGADAVTDGARASGSYGIPDNCVTV
jgi:hypothetical protein